jgi:hypothetical protein
MERECKPRRTNFANILWKNRTLSDDSRKWKVNPFVRLALRAKLHEQIPKAGQELPLVENGRAKGFKSKRL